MSPEGATACFVVVVAILFVLDRDANARTSRALWIPVVWLSLATSRMVSQWMGTADTILYAEQAMEGNALDRNVLTGLIVLGLIVLAQRRRALGAILSQNRAILVFFAYCAFSIVWSGYPDIAFKRWTKAIGDLIMVLVVLTDRNPSAAIKQFLKRVAFVLIPGSVLFIKYYPSLGQNYSGVEGKVRYTGVTIDKNTLGMLCLIAGLAFVWRVLELVGSRKGSRKQPLLAQTILLVMVAWLFWKANSMTSLACFVLAGGLMVGTRIPWLNRKAWVAHFSMLAVVSIAFLALLVGVGTEFLGRDATLTGRVGLWRDVLKMDTSPLPLFGAGFESFWLGDHLQELWSIYWWHPNEAHNGYLEVFLNLGWVGVCLLAAAIIKGYRRVVSAFVNEPETGGLRLSYFAAGIILSMTEAGFRVLNPMWILFLMVIVAAPVVPLAPQLRGHVRRSLARSVERFSVLSAGREVLQRPAGSSSQ